MTKSVRAKQEKKKDFVKKKIKVGKILKKAQNETITTFKSRSISIVEQLKKKEAGDNVTKKRYTMMELCIRFNHSNPNHKLDACSGVKELLGKLHPEQVRESLSALIGALSRCMLDDDWKVRTTTIRLIDTLIDKVGSSSLSPHFTLLGRHLSCGLVSLYSDVQASALQLLHMLLQRAPALLHLHANTIVPNLLRLLGAKTKSGGALQKEFTESLGGKLPTPKTGPKSILKNNKNNNKDDNKSSSNKNSSGVLVVHGQQNSKQNCLLWQLDVFVLLTAILTHVIKYKTSSSNKNVGGGGATNDNNNNNADKQLQSALQSRWQTLLHAAAAHTASESSVRVAGDGTAPCSRFALLTQPSKLQDFCTAMMPLLYNLWTNMLPECTKQRGGVQMSASCSHCLWCLVKLQEVLATMVLTCTGHPATQCLWFMTLMKNIFGDLLHNHFPIHYATPAVTGSKTSKSNKSRYDEQPTASSHDLNLRLATLGVKFTLFNEKQNYMLVNYVTELMSSSEEVGSYDMQSACQLSVVLVDFFTPAPSHQRQLNSSKLTNKTSVANRILSVAHSCYKKQHPLKKERKLLLTMLLKVTDADHMHLHE
uniref:Pre-rRNA-processing protein ipi1-like n=1 Tax=Hirondellea gigas TaxID=1518452 RepID=A0A6A7FP99_9CRUS